MAEVDVAPTLGAELKVCPFCPGLWGREGGRIISSST